MKEAKVGFVTKKESYVGGIKEISLGKGAGAVKVGGETCFPFYTFEGAMPNKPIIAMEIWDMVPEDWAEPAVAPFKDVLSDPAAWAKRCVEEFGADAIVLQLKSTDPNDKDVSPEAAAATVKKVLAAIKVPLIVWGCAVPAKDELVLKAVAEACQGENLLLGPVEEKNYKGIGAAAMGYGHSIIASSPIDVNLAKQVNILLENLGMPMDRLVVDPTTGGLGYGLEYTYSVMERLTLAAMTQGDEKLQFPMINNLGNEIWKSKEAKQTVEAEPILGDPERRGVMMESVGAVSYLMSGSNILVMRHPEAVRMVREFIKSLSGGGSLQGVAALSKRLPEASIDFAAMAPAYDLTIEEEKKAAAPAAKKAAPAAAAPKAPAAAAPKAPAAATPKTEAPKAEAAPAVAPVVDDATVKAEAAAKAKLEAEAKAKADAEAKVKAEAKAKTDAEAAAKAKEEEAKKVAAEAYAAREAEEAAIRAQRAQSHAAAEEEAAPVALGRMTAAVVQKDQQEKILDNLSRIHRR
ncbi:MAG: acetyl-CoA decarbonylase/synthase complex subunit delta [Desulfobulbaceae bacterium]|jgi:acetyl-CoA decarbonylase/synthase complex subunit delta|nr:acetyl-CoA decarbonylase/synthase complex subunit delta [Desulfobulbaceae bacterium]